VVAKFLERIRFREWVLAHVPFAEHSPKAKGVCEKVLALLLTSPTGGSRFSHVTGWSYGMESLKACFGVMWMQCTLSAILLGEPPPVPFQPRHGKDEAEAAEFIHLLQSPRHGLWRTVHIHAWPLSF
jgi:hypothetical protein